MPTESDSPEALAKAMAGSLDDKLWFLPVLNGRAQAILDFGCADGALLGAIHRRTSPYISPPPPLSLYGYDHDPVMRHLAKSAHGNLPIAFADNVAQLERYAKQERKAGHKTCLVLSSVLHEVISVTGLTLPLFWNVVRAIGADYIAVRDMAVEASMYREEVRPEVLHALCLSPGIEALRENAKMPLETMADAAHLLLKAPYKDHPREWRENYLPMSFESYLNHLTVGSGYELRHAEHYAMPYLTQRWSREFGIEWNEPTHFKVLLRKSRYGNVYGG